MIAIRTAMLAALIALPGPARAVGPDDLPPTPTETTTTCEDGQVWDAAISACVDPQSGRLSDEQLYDAAREFAYVGQPNAALAALDAMDEQTGDAVLTLRGFAHRKAGDSARAMAFYTEALERNPDNILARSYMGQGLAEAGEMAAARAQLSEIRARGGRATWAEFALRQSIETGRGTAY